MIASAPLAFPAAPQTPSAAVPALTRPASVSEPRQATVAAPSPSTPLPTRITRYRRGADEVPVDFFADPDGAWEFSSLVEMAGFNPEHPGASVGALTQPFDGYPEGAAVITEVGVGCRYVAIAELPKVSPTGVASRLGPEGSSSPVRSSQIPRDRRPHRAA